MVRARQRARLLTPLTAFDLTILHSLHDVTWLRPRDLGCSDASALHRSLRKLVQRGLAIAQTSGFKRGRTYRRTAAGRVTLASTPTDLAANDTTVMRSVFDSPEESAAVWVAAVLSGMD